MKSDIERAKETLRQGGFTCVMCCGRETLTTELRGVKPLLEWIDSGRDLSSFSAADKVVGNGAAFLYVILGVKELYANVMSRSAQRTLERYSVKFSFAESAEVIKNRAGDGICPMEEAVASAENPKEALAAVRAKVKELAAQ